MGNTPPTLDYAAAKPRSRLRKWTRRILLAVLVLACLYATPIVWLYWGWKQEQPAREMVKRVGSSIEKMEPAGPAFLGRLIPARLGWTRERIAGILLRTRASDDDLRTLRRLRSLKELYLVGSRVTDAGLVHVEELTGLQVLCLRRTQVTDAGLVHLKALARLQLLYLEHMQVTDAGLVHLKGLTGLQYLCLQDTPVTNAGVAELQKALPQCEIAH